MWWALAISPVRRQDLASLSEHLFRLGASGVQEEPVPGQERPPRQPWDSGRASPEAAQVVLTAWFEVDETQILEAEVRRRSAGTTLVWTPVEDRDWEAEYRATVQPLRLGRLVIVPPWAPEPGALILEPGLGFGTGDHPTTRQALVALEAAVGPGTGSVLDVGCGSGILALAAARLGAERVLGVDVESTAIVEARRHAASNGLNVVFERTPVARLSGPWDIVVANLHAELIVTLAGPLRRLTGGRLILAGILAEREHLVRDALGWEPTERTQEGEWVSWVVVR